MPLALFILIAKPASCSGNRRISTPSQSNTQRNTSSAKGSSNRLSEYSIPYPIQRSSFSSTAFQFKEDRSASTRALAPAPERFPCSQAKRWLKMAIKLVRLREVKVRAIVLIGQDFSACGYSPTRTKLNGSELASDIFAFARECRW